MATNRVHVNTCHSFQNVTTNALLRTEKSSTFRVFVLGTMTSFLSLFSAVGISKSTRICANYSNPWIFVCLLLIVLLPMTVLTILCAFGKYCECYNKALTTTRLLSLYYWILIWILVILGMLCPSCCGYHCMYIHFLLF